MRKNIKLSLHKFMKLQKGSQGNSVKILEYSVNRISQEVQIESYTSNLQSFSVSIKQ